VLTDAERTQLAEIVAKFRDDLKAVNASTTTT